MTVRELLSRITASELAEWVALYRLEAEETKTAQAKANGRASR
jgi:hypothetical protein